MDYDMRCAATPLLGGGDDHDDGGESGGQSQKE